MKIQGDEATDNYLNADCVALSGSANYQWDDQKCNGSKTFICNNGSKTATITAVVISHGVQAHYKIRMSSN